MELIEDCVGQRSTSAADTLLAFTHSVAVCRWWLLLPPRSLGFERVRVAESKKRLQARASRARGQGPGSARAAPCSAPAEPLRVGKYVNLA
jgi:hypothetical protein